MDNRNNLGNASSGIILLLIIIVSAIGVYILFFKDKTSQEQSPVQEQEIEKVDSNVKKIELVKKVSGTSGELYLDKDGKVYLVLANDMSFSNLSSLAQEFHVEKNETYNYDLINGILLTIPAVKEISYDETNVKFTLTTTDEKKYFINDNDVKSNNRVLIEVDTLDTTENTIDANDTTDTTKDDTKKDDEKKDDTSNPRDNGSTSSKEDIIKQRGQKVQQN